MRRLLLPLLVIALAFAGCGGDDESSETPATEPAATTEATTTPGAGGEDVVVVKMQNIAFSPATVDTQVGQTIRWENEDDVQHDADATSGAEFESDLFGKGGTFEYTTEKAGTIEYVCSVHPNMKGTINVE